QLLPAVESRSHYVRTSERAPRHHRVAIEELRLNGELVGINRVHRGPQLTRVVRDRCSCQCPSTLDTRLVEHVPDGPCLLGLRVLNAVRLVKHARLEREVVELLPVRLAPGGIDALVTVLRIALATLLQSNRAVTGQPGPLPHCL